MEFSESFAWQSGQLDEMKRIIANYVVQEAPAEDDQQRNTDLLVPSARIACRVRKYADMARYGGEFTIRSARSSGRQTELQKVVSGWGDYIFYAFSTEDETGFAAWLLGDLSVFRLWFNQTLARHQTPWIERQNVDSRRSSFLAFRIEDVRVERGPEFVVGRVLPARIGMEVAS
jgi:hypothetical protein